MNKRPEEISALFNNILDTHLRKIIRGIEDHFLSIHEVAAMLYIHPTHLSNTVKATTGRSPCDICNEKTIKAAQELLANSSLSIADIAIKLTFEPTNFTKYFRKHTGQTPSAFRKEQTNTLL